MNLINQQLQAIRLKPEKINQINAILNFAIQLSLKQSIGIFKEVTLLLKIIQDKEPKLQNFITTKIEFITQVLIKYDEQQIQQLQIYFSFLAQLIDSLSINKKQAILHKFIFKNFIEGKIQNLIQSQQKWSHLTNTSLISNINKQLLVLIDTNQNQNFIMQVIYFIIGLPNVNKLINSNSLSQMKKSYQKLLIKVINCQYKGDRICHLYRNIGQRVFSKFQNPLIIVEFLLAEYKNSCIETKIEVLPILFILVGKYGLQFEQYYPQLQKILQLKSQGRSIYQFGNSRRFFKLIQSSLRSSKVPFKIISTFTHLIVGQILSQNSEFTFWALSLIVNLTKKHRKLLEFVRNIPQIQLLNHHYNARVRTLVKELNKNLNRIQYFDIEQFSKIDCRKLWLQKRQKINRQLQSIEGQFKVPKLGYIL